jgi:tetratricopeptide (TPR) repeat protein/mono/diheme cytochrome c family protein
MKLMPGLAAMIVAAGVCAPLTSAAGLPPAVQPAPVTFAADIAPILAAHCVSCHHPGGSAPFSLLTYQDVRARARSVASAVAARIMPPWKPEPGHGEFVGSRRLADRQVEAIEAWVAQDCPPGDLRGIPSLPDASQGWQLGTPDMVLTVSPSYDLAPGGSDRMRNFVVPIPVGMERFVKGWEFRTDAPQVVHHATMVIDRTRASRSLDDADPLPGFEGLIPMSAHNPDGFFLGWTPGQTPHLAADGLAWPVPVDTDLVMMLHLRPTAKWEQVSVAMGLYFTEAAPAQRPAMIRLNRQDLDIPAGERRYRAADSYTLPVPVTVHGIQPHAHNLAREVRATATLPDGTARPLIYIRDWNFHWQDAYRYARPIPLPAGTRLEMEYLYDNSGGNPANPNFPPKRVTYGQRTSDEMGDVWIQVVPERSSDLPLLNVDLRRALLPKTIAGYQLMIAGDPGNADLHNDLALLYVEAGNPGKAAAEFTESLRLNPSRPAAHYNVANAELMAGRMEQAERHFRNALALDAGYGLAHQGLGLTLRAIGRLDDASDHLERAAALLGSAEAHFNLGVLRQQQGRPAEALAQYREALSRDARFTAAERAIDALDATARRQ